MSFGTVNQNPKYNFQRDFKAWRCIKGRLQTSYILNSPIKKKKERIHCDRIQIDQEDGPSGKPAIAAEVTPLCH